MTLEVLPKCFKELMKDPDFYLASSDSYNLAISRRVWGVKRMSIPKRNDVLLARIDPPISNREHGGNYSNIDLVLLVTRHKGTSLFPVSEWPLSVYVVRPLVNVEDRDSLNLDEFENIAWAALYRTEQDVQRQSR
jgi:hypothetical protein